MSTLNVARIRKDFPILSRTIRGKSLVYLDNAATLQKPQSVIDAISRFYSDSNANVHRGVHFLSQIATQAYEGVRPKVCRFLGTENDKEIIFTRGTTEGVNLVASGLAGLLDGRLSAGDSVAVTRMEHHSNFVPWQQLAIRTGAAFRIIELDAEQRISPESLASVLALKPKILAVTLMSNVTGVINDIAAIARQAKTAGALVFVDAAQGAPHLPLNLPELGPIDFLAFSSHKIGGPTGVGVLWGREELLRKLPPCQFGGDMISQVGDEKTTWNDLPWKFEAGTPNIADVVGLGAALDYVSRIGMPSIQEYERELIAHALASLRRVSGLKVFGPETASQRGSVVSFSMEGVHPHDLATFLDEEGIAVRAGHHCAQPLLAHSRLPALTRASFSFYNTTAEADALTGALTRARKYFDRGAKDEKKRGTHVNA